MDWPGPEFDGMDFDDDPPEDANLKRNTTDARPSKKRKVLGESETPPPDR